MQGDAWMRKIYTNGKIYTFDQEKPYVTAVVVENGRFIDLGSTEDMILRWGRADSKVIDLQGKAVTPGLIDSHLHLSGIASSFLDLDVTGMTSKQKMIEKIQAQANTLQEDEWLIGRGWDENLFTDGGIPTIEELDRAAPHVPLFITRVCSHAFLVNTKALEYCGYHPSMTVPEGGTIVLDKKTKQPTGLLLESASELITDRKKICLPMGGFLPLKNSIELHRTYLYLSRGSAVMPFLSIQKHWNIAGTIRR